MEELNHLLSEAENYYNQQQHAKSLEYCEQAFTLDGSNETASFFTALNHYALHNLPQSILYFERAFSLMKSRPPFWEMYAIALSLTGRVKEAINEFNSIIEAHPNYTNALYNCGYCLLGNKRYEEDITYFDRAEASGTQTALLYFHRGVSYFNLHQWYKAQVDLKKSEQLNNENPETAFVLGEICFHYGQHAEAIAYYSKALYFKPDFHKALTQRLISRVNLKDENGNITDIEGAQADADRILAENISFLSITSKEGNHLKIVAINISPDGKINAETQD